MIESEFSTVVQDSRGRMYLAGPYATQIVVFDRDGRFLKTLGRGGHGPGEFAGIGSMQIGPGDSLFVFDNPESRLSVFSPELKFIRSARLALVPQVNNTVLPDGRIVIGRSVLTRELAGQPLHLLDRDGGRVRSFGNLSGILRPDVPGMLDRTVATSRGRYIWSAHQVEYVIDRIDVETGTITDVIRRNASWFPSRMKPQTRPEDIRAEPAVIDLQEDDAGRLWMLIAVPDKDWRKQLVPPQAGDQHGTVRDMQRFYDTRIEVLDPAQGRLIASLRIPEYVQQFCGPREIGYVSLDHDVPRFHRWRLMLSQR
ncbi:MAG TPA: 6-bladed beta-propeller [Gemmatimonadaceae bacterium]|nr:6-bladed beta-propeller [Gemmatimonadaceae bacterium]